MKIRRKSEFHKIVVEVSGGVRTLQFDDTIQSTMHVDEAIDAGLEYVDFFHIPMLLRDSIRRTLFIGLGGATGPRQFVRDYPAMKIDVVEIDPEVIRLAEEHFGFAQSARCRAHAADGLSFLERTRRVWDLIIIDAYAVDEEGELYIPPELASERFLELCRGRMPSAGVVVFNSAASMREKMSRRVLEVTAAVFPHRLIFQASNAHNTVVVASGEALENRAARLVELARRSRRQDVVERRSLVRRCRQLRA